MGKSESAHQASFFQWLEFQQYHGLHVRDFSFAIPNGGTRHKLEAIKLKKEGVTSSIPDLMIAIPCRGYHGLFIEMKKPENKPQEFRYLIGKQKSGEHIREQKEKLAQLASVGYLAVFAWGCEEAKEIAEWYFSGSLYPKSPD